MQSSTYQSVSVRINTSVHISMHNCKPSGGPPTLSRTHNQDIRAILLAGREHLGLCRGNLVAILGGLVGYLGPPWGQLLQRWGHLGLSWENLGTTWVSFGHHKSCEVEFVDFTKVL